MQTKRISLIETLVGIVIGFLVFMLLTVFVFPLYGHQINLADNLQITVVFTVASVIRGYFVRRFFVRVWR